MRRIFFTVIIFIQAISFCQQQEPERMLISGAWKFKTGDNADWLKPHFDDSTWDTISTGKAFESQGYAKYDGFVWYRKSVVISSIMKKGISSDYKSLFLLLGYIDDVDQTYFNGQLIGSTGNIKRDVDFSYSMQRKYLVSENLINWDKENVIAVRVRDYKGNGGLYKGPYELYPAGIRDYVSINHDVASESCTFEKGEMPLVNVIVNNNSPENIKGLIHYSVNLNMHKTVFKRDVAFSVNKFDSTIVEISYNAKEPGFFQLDYVCSLNNIDSIKKGSTWFAYDPNSLNIKKERAANYNESSENFIKELHFNNNGEFKILQFTDLHIKMVSQGKSERIFDAITNIVDLENPDLVVLTGDIITQDSVYFVLKRLAGIFAEREIPWTAVMGNHDEEYAEMSRKELAILYRSLPYNINLFADGVKGVTNFVIPINSTDNKMRSLLYFFDSNDYNTLKGIVESRYGWFSFSQIAWYRQQSELYRQKNGGVPLPALAFFHIPFPEYKDLWQKDSSNCIGSKKGGVSSPSINSGMYAAMLECGDIMGAFVGHDHSNDYIGSLNGIALAYGKFTGGEDITQGARVIVLKEGKREFETWLRERGRKMLYKCYFPDSFSTLETLKLEKNMQK